MTSDSFIQLRRNEFRAFRTMFRPALRCAATALWTELLVRANWEDGYFDGQQLKRGQVVFGREELGEHTGVPVQTVRTVLKKLEKMKKLTIKSTSQGSIANIEEYEAYVGKLSKTNQPTNQQLTNDQPTTNHSEETNKQINEEGTKSLKDLYLKKREEEWNDQHDTQWTV